MSGTISKPAFPAVPLAPGVPALPRLAGITLATPVILAADVLSIYSLFQPAQWGFYTLDNSPAFDASGGIDVSTPFGSVNLGGLAAGALRLLGPQSQSVVDFEYRQENRISSAPQEQGSFLSYNKVGSPFNGRVSYAVGGLESQRSAFLSQVDTKISGLELLNLVMPERTYKNVNITHYDFKRTARNGVTMFLVNIWCEEIRIVQPAAFSNTKLPTGVANQNVGTVAPVTATPLPPAT